MNSPCVKICLLNDDKVCVACFRHVSEIAKWSKLLTEQKEAVMNDYENREENMTLHPMYISLREAQKKACQEMNLDFEAIYRRGRPSQEIIDAKKNLEPLIRKYLNSEEISYERKTVPEVKHRVVASSTSKPLHSIVFEKNILEMSDEELLRCVPSFLRKGK